MCGGYRIIPIMRNCIIRCFPCVRGLSERSSCTTVPLSVFPLCGGYRRTPKKHRARANVFPLCGGVIGELGGVIVDGLCVSPVRGVIGRGTCTRRVRSGVSPAWGLSVPVWFLDYFHLVFPLCGGYWLVRNPAFHRR